MPESHKVPRVSTPNIERVCRLTPGKRGYCGRRSAPLVATWDATTCADCHACRRADEAARR